MPKDINKCLTTYFDVPIVLENFLSSHKQGALPSKPSFFEQFLIKFEFWRALKCLKPQKSASGDVFAIKNRLKHRLMLSFASTCSHGLQQVCNNLFWCFWCIKKFFTDPQASRGVVQRSLVASNFASQRPKSLPKRKKFKNCVVRRLITPLHSKYAQGPKQVPNNLFWCSYCPRKVFARPQLADFCGFRHSKCLQKSNFIKNCSKITILKFTLFVCGRTKTFLGQ